MTARQLAVRIACLTMAISACPALAIPLGTAFTYQGQLKFNSSPSDGPHDFEFRLFDALNGGLQVGSMVPVSDLDVVDGLFTITLDFGATAFDGNARWLEIRVRPGAQTGAYTLLTPRQEITPVPYALKVPGIDGHSLNASDGNPLDALFVDAGGRVGIGTTAPASVITNSKMDVIGGHIALSNNFGVLSFNAAGTGIGAGLDTMPDDSMRLYANGNPHLFILPSGNVGIGATSPAQKLSVAGMIQSLSGGFMFPDGSVQTQAASGGPGFWNANGTHIFNNNAGNVGVGINTPATKLEVVGTTEFGIRYRRSNGRDARISVADPTRSWSLSSGWQTDGDFSLVEEGVAGDRLYIQKNTGNVGIGLSNPSAKLDVNGNIEAAQLFGTAIIGRGSGEGAIGLHGIGRQVALGVSGVGVVGESENSTGVHGESTDGWGVFGRSQSSHGVFGQTINGNAAAVLGRNEGPNGQAVTGYASNGAVGVLAVSEGNDGLSARTNAANKSAVFGYTEQPSSFGGFFMNAGGGVALNVAGRARVGILEITGADVSEKFPVSEPGALKPGQVVAIDERNAGKLCLARGAYNPRVAGVVSGAGDIPVGAILGNLPGNEDAPPVALSGRVWCWCDASECTIQPGDLLTTSGTPGHAMKATDREHSHGAILGKSMSSLAHGEKGLVLVLVNLQ